MLVPRRDGGGDGAVSNEVGEVGFADEGHVSQLYRGQQAFDGLRGGLRRDAGAGEVGGHAEGNFRLGAGTNEIAVGDRGATGEECGDERVIDRVRHAQYGLAGGAGGGEFPSLRGLGRDGVDRRPRHPGWRRRD